MSYTIRLATLNDAERLLEIYAPYVTDTAITFEYDIPTLEDFRGRIENTLRKYPYLVLEESTEGAAPIIVGYAYASAFKGRAAYNWSVETSIYLEESAQGKGYGKALYNALEIELEKQNISNVNACIAYAKENSTHLTNASMHFHEVLGYTLVGRFHNCAYKFGEWYDMIWMEKMISGHPDDAPAFIPYSEL